MHSCDPTAILSRIKHSEFPTSAMNHTVLLSRKSTSESNPAAIRAPALFNTGARGSDVHDIFCSDSRHSWTWRRLSFVDQAYSRPSPALSKIKYPFVPSDTRSDQASLPVLGSSWIVRSSNSPVSRLTSETAKVWFDSQRIAPLPRAYSL